MSQPSPASVVRPRGRSPLVLTIAVLLLLAVLLGLTAEFWTEVLWYRQLGFGSVFRTRLVTQGVIFLIVGVAAGAAVGASMWLAYRQRPEFSLFSMQNQSIERYRDGVEPVRRLVAWGLPVGLGLFAGSWAAQQWQVVLAWWFRSPFGVNDPQFHQDVGFYVFTLPFLRFVIGFLVAVVLLSLIGALVTHYIYGGLRVAGPGPRVTGPARVHLAGLIAVLFLLRAAQYWLGRYTTLTSVNDRFTGAGYTDVNARIPALGMLAGIAIVVGLLFFATMVRQGWRLAGIGVALMVVSSLVLSTALPALMQKFQVQPSQQTKERDYIARNIEATRAAYGLADVEVTPYNPRQTVEQGQLRQDEVATANVRLLDPAVVSPAFRQLERGKQYYTFANPLDVGRYTIDGHVRDTVIAVRELNRDGLPADQRSWYNDHAVYTHGFGVVAAYGNRSMPGGDPDFFQKGIPGKGDLGDFEPRIYFGEVSPDFSIVGGPQDGPKRELDYPTDTQGSGQANYTFTGNGGPRLSGLGTRLLYALKFRDQNILLSDAVNDDSQILYDRHPRERVKKVAPFLTLDGDPYPAVVDGQVQWILDGYTTTDAYPYSALRTLGPTTNDQAQGAAPGGVATLTGQRINYIRNSVKATVNAFDGSVKLYTWDDKDPLLKTWSKAFPGVIQPMSKIDGQLMSHLRYPEDVFKVQRAVLGQYHATDPDVFYTGGEFWQIPDDPTTAEGQARAKQPPYYLTMQMPGQKTPSFSLSSTYIPQSGARDENQILAGFVAVDADAGHTPGERAPGYGKIRVLGLPRASTVPGPGQVQVEFTTRPNVAELVNILARGDSKVTRGNLLTLPAGGGLLYVQPLYVESSQASFPKLRKVLVFFGAEAGFGDTLGEALDQVFKGNSGARTGEKPPAGTTPGAPPAPVDAATRRSQALADAGKAFAESQDALSRKDFTAYGQAQKRLDDALKLALAADAEAKTQAPATPAPGQTPAPNP